MTLKLWFRVPNEGLAQWQSFFFVEVTDKNLNSNFPLDTLTNPALVLG